MSTHDPLERFIQPIGASLSDEPLSRRAFLGWGSLGAATLAAGWPRSADASKAGDSERPAWMRSPGRGPSGYGGPAPPEADLLRQIQNRYGAIAPGAAASTTPLEGLEGTITPSGLHFERHHSGIPKIEPASHALLIDGDVARPLLFSVEDLLRYPMKTRTCFIECSGNSAPNIAPEPLQLSCGAIHGLVSCSEWTGVPLSLLLDEAGIRDPEGWVIAEGADSCALNRSIPLSLVAEEGLIALYQNGERLRPEQGYPLRLVAPGLEGNVNVKWLRRIEVRGAPAHSREETSKYTDLLGDGSARQFTLRMDVKSVITRPSAGMRLPESGLYEVTGLAWSGHGRIARVDVSTDGGRSFRRAALEGPVLPKSLTRFRIPWRWQSGQPALLQSRATDETGETQPQRAQWVRTRAPSTKYHYNAIQSWRVAPDGLVSNSHA